MACLIETGRTSAIRRPGFTLIELLVVLSIIGTLLAIAVPRYFHALERSKETVLRQDLSVMREAIDKYYGDVGHYPESLVALVDSRYLRAIPIDPLAKTADKWVLVSAEGDNVGVRDVHSGAEGAGMDGTPLGEW